MSRTLVVIQARMGSSRLPGKVALPLAGAPLLLRMVERVRAATTPFAMCIATSVLPEDDRIVELAAAAELPVYRGHPLDCLDRHLGAARQLGAEHIVKIPSDCPLIDPAAIDLVLAAYFDSPGRYDFVSNLHPATWPDGNDVEVTSTDLLELASREAARNYEREHTTPFFWENPERFRIGNVSNPSGADLSMSHRFTIDYEEDYRFISAIYDALYGDGNVFTLGEILELCARRPELMQLNESRRGVNWYRHHIDQLRTITPSMTRLTES